MVIDTDDACCNQKTNTQTDALNPAVRMFGRVVFRVEIHSVHEPKNTEDKLRNKKPQVKIKGILRKIIVIRTENIKIKNQ